MLEISNHTLQTYKEAERATKSKTRWRMCMGLLDLFNQWIVERGSATVQEKHIALFRDQLTLADKRITELESEITSLKSKLKNSQTTINQLTKESAELKKINHVSEKTSHDDSLPKEQEKILLFLAANSDQMFSSNTIMLECGLSEHKALYHIKKLEEDVLIASEFTDGEYYYSLDDDGRAYLVEHDLIE
jgi:hypothetical protein